MTRRRRAVRPLSVCSDLYSAHTRDLPSCLPACNDQDKERKKKTEDRRGSGCGKSSEGKKKDDRGGLFGRRRNRMAGLIAGCCTGSSRPAYQVLAPKRGSNKGDERVKVGASVPCSVGLKV